MTDTYRYDATRVAAEISEAVEAGEELEKVRGESLEPRQREALEGIRLARDAFMQAFSGEIAP